MSVEELKLQKYEIEVLVTYHRNQQYEFSNKEDYFNADYHKKRSKELADFLITWKD